MGTVQQRSSAGGGVLNGGRKPAKPKPAQRDPYALVQNADGSYSTADAVRYEGSNAPSNQRVWAPAPRDFNGGARVGPEMGPYRPDDPRAANMQTGYAAPLSGSRVNGVADQYKTASPDQQLQDFLASLATPGLASDSYASSIAGSLQSELQNQLDYIAKAYDTQKGLIDSGKAQGGVDISSALQQHQQGLQRVAQDYSAQAAQIDAQLSKMYAGTLATVQDSSKALTDQLAKMGIDPAQFAAMTGNADQNIADQQTAQSGFSGRLDQLQNASNADRQRLGESINQAGNTQLTVNYEQALAGLNLQRFQKEAEAQASYEAGLRASKSGSGGGGGSGDPYAPQNFDDVLAAEKFAYQQDQDASKAQQGPLGKDYFDLNGQYDTNALNPRNANDAMALEAISTGDPEKYLKTLFTDNANTLDKDRYSSIMALVGRTRSSQQNRAQGGPGALSGEEIRRRAQAQAKQNRINAAKRKVSTSSRSTTSSRSGR